MKKYRNKYRIASTRAPFWDYGWNAAYFITICTQNRVHYFGKINDDNEKIPSVSLSEIGKIAQRCWLEIPQHFPFVKLDAHIVMPNHVHGIVIIDKQNDCNGRRDGGCDGGWFVVETQNFASLQTNKKNPKNQFGPQSKNLASIIRGFKIGVTKNARMINPGFAWQSRYHDHVIRNEKSYQKISEYILNNPSKWQEVNSTIRRNTQPIWKHFQK